MSQNRTIVDILSTHALAKPRQTAFRFLADGETESARVSYMQLHQQAQAIAARLQTQLRIGDRAILVYPDSGGLEFIAAFLGCLYAGIIAVPINPTRNTRSIKQLIARTEFCEAKITLTTKAFQHYLFQRVEDDQTLTQQLSTAAWFNTDEIDIAAANDWVAPTLTPDTIAFFQHTSGSTGQAKAAIITHENLLYNASIIYQALEHSDQSSFVSWLPLFHDMGLIGGIIQPLFGGFPCTLIPPNVWHQKPLCWLKAISRYRATTSGGPNFAYEHLARTTTRAEAHALNLETWSVAFTGSEMVRANTLAHFSDVFKPAGFSQKAFYPCYGMAEATLFSTGIQKSDAPKVLHLNADALMQNRAELIAPKSVSLGSPQQPDSLRTTAIVSCGKVWGDDKIIIVDPDTGQPCTEQQIGEVWLQSKSIAQGYWHLPVETDKTFSARLHRDDLNHQVLETHPLETHPLENKPLRNQGSSVHVTNDIGPFLKTGDLGFMLEGNLYITGRLKEIMSFKGRYHYPQDIEATAEAAHNALRPGAGAAFSIEAENDERLVLVHEIKRTHLKKFSMQDCIKELTAAVKHAHGLDLYAINFLKPGALPKTTSGKTRRQTCKQLFLQQELLSIAQWRA